MASPPPLTDRQRLALQLSSIKLKRSRKGYICPGCGEAKSPGEAMCLNCLHVQSEETLAMLAVQPTLGVGIGYEAGMLKALLKVGARCFQEEMVIPTPQSKGYTKGWYEIVLIEPSGEASRRKNSRIVYVALAIAVRWAMRAQRECKSVVWGSGRIVASFKGVR